MRYARSADNRVPLEGGACPPHLAGTAATVASDVPHGRNLLRSGQFDPILIKWETPGIDRPVAYGDAERCRELGFDDHPFEPLHRGQMLALLNRQRRKLAPGEDAGAGAAPAPPVLDPVALARLAELDPAGANRLLERVLQAFQTSVTRLRPKLVTGPAETDRAAIRLVTHTLKSSSASIGALRLSQLCAEIETAIRLDPDAELGERLVALDAALDATLQAIAMKLEARE